MHFVRCLPYDAEPRVHRQASTNLHYHLILSLGSSPPFEASMEKVRGRFPGGVLGPEVSANLPGSGWDVLVHLFPRDVGGCSVALGDSVFGVEQQAPSSFWNGLSPPPVIPSSIRSLSSGELSCVENGTEVHLSSLFIKTPLHRISFLLCIVWMITSLKGMH
jgi:hypothetical protein